MGMVVLAELQLAGFLGRGQQEGEGGEEGIKGTWEGQDTDPFCTDWK